MPLVLPFRNVHEIAVEDTDRLASASHAPRRPGEEEDGLRGQIRGVAAVVDHLLFEPGVAENAEAAGFTGTGVRNLRRIQCHGSVVPGAAKRFVTAVFFPEPGAEFSYVRRREIAASALFPVGPQQPLVGRAGTKMVACHAVGVRGGFDVADQFFQCGERIAAPEFRSPARRRIRLIAVGVGEKFGDGTILFPDFDGLLRMLPAPPDRRAHDQPDDQTRVGSRVQKGHRPLIQLGEVEFLRGDPGRVGGVAGGVGRRRDEGEEVDPDLAEVPGDGL